MGYTKTRSIQHGVSSRHTSQGICADMRVADVKAADFTMGVFAGLVMDKSNVVTTTSFSPRLLRYETGQYATKHCDAITEDEMAQFDTPHQHLFTMIAYLNDEYTGGELVFDALDLCIKPVAGDVYIWCNVVNPIEKMQRKAYCVNRKSRHRSLPVKTGTKHSLVKFFI